MFDETDALIRTNWEQVSAIAEALMDRRTLSGEEINEVVQI